MVRYITLPKYVYVVTFKKYRICRLDVSNDEFRRPRAHRNDLGMTSVQTSDVADQKVGYEYRRISKSRIRISSDSLKFQIVGFGYPKSRIFSSNTLQFS